MKVLSENHQVPALLR